MPQKNTLKVYSPESYYHIYSRGTNKQKIFISAADYTYFEHLLERYLGPEIVVSAAGVAYPNYHEQVRLLAYCLMPNHIHLLVYQNEEAESVSSLMRSLLTSYSKYFNARYKRVGTLFESRYKAKRIDNDMYLQHIGRYIHMNPRNWQTWRHSSLQYIFAREVPLWLSVEEVTQDFEDRVDYVQFLEEYQTQKDSLELIKRELADK
jgi:putative transposase